MRRPRLIVFEGDPLMSRLIRDYLSMMNYELMFYREPVVCPLYEGTSQTCSSANPCSDIIITEQEFPGMTGIELLAGQAARGCRVSMKNKALMAEGVTGILEEEVRNLGCAVLPKPLRFPQLYVWLKECESRIDVSQPLGVLRRADRYPVEMKVRFLVGKQPERCEGELVNISEFGLCLKSPVPLAENQSLQIETELPNACRLGSVRWARRANGGCFVGVSCG